MRIKKNITLIAAALSLMFNAAASGKVLTSTNPGDADAKQTTALSKTDNQVSIVSERTITFEQLGYQGSISMMGSESNAYVGFGSRIDEVVSKADLYFDITSSPALLALMSHIKVFLNNELMGVAAVDDGQQGKKISLSIPLDTRYFSNYNQIRFELIGNTSNTCANPNDPGIWAEISQSSRIVMQVQKTELKSDLSLLPAPFFDKRDFSKLRLPVVMGSSYDLNELKAAGILTSYFGSLAEWRGAEFPLLYDKAPERNAVVFISNDNKPEFLRDFPDAEGPMLQVVSHPANPYVKLLLVIGRDSEDLNTAVKGLALGTRLLTGPIAKINKAVQIKPRQPYDAPNWITTSKPVTLSELTEHENQLQVEGRIPAPIRVSLKLPPDLFTWDSRGIPMDLNYRYSPPVSDNSGSRLSLSINNQFIEAFNLTTDGQAGESKRIRVPVLDNNMLSGGNRVRIPAFKAGSDNQIEFEFGFASSSDGMCQAALPSKQYAVVDGDSTIDFSGFPHYMEMPNMRAFAASGYPFTRMADLSETVVVLPPNPPRELIQTYLNLLGSIGADSGYPAVNVAVTDQWSKEQLNNKDILSIGVVPQLSDAAFDEDQVNLVLKAGERLIRLPSKNEPQLGMNWLDPSNEAQDASDIVSVDAYGAFAAITGAESPFTKNRSLVSIMGANPDDFSLIDSALADSGKIEHMFGSVVTLRNDEVASYNVGDHYYVGKLPVWKLIWYHFSNRPVFLAFIAMLLVVVVTIGLWRVLRNISKRRIAEGEGEQ
ncbi:cellulose biosynthesis cyclic di-GMP-binding regulatory protein BcsB [Psychromonas aquimarina]|uniref:cellulose biosynthesis cyclic di-GMP-binding regulatory protein BcsB n=1 Tax=Psychromonas aquimarina TaxID=444919 RepID=UPI0004268176|nr:cellulose biosynthesis cyclic di-GMP-binding regulatory protein BcsB [Psychromonas aquimarina]